VKRGRRRGRGKLLAPFGPGSGADGRRFGSFDGGRITGQRRDLASFGVR
jgi:hypothetical protein